MTSLFERHLLLVRLTAGVCAALLISFASVLVKGERASASPGGALALADHALSSAAGLDDEGRYRLIDAIGPGGISLLAARDEVFASTMVGGQYGMYDPVRDPFAGDSSGGINPPMPYGPPRKEWYDIP